MGAGVLVFDVVRVVGGDEGDVEVVFEAGRWASVTALSGSRP